MIFADYQSLVLQEYKRMRAAGMLSHRLIRLTPAKIKEECELVCDRRYDRRDEKTLEEFFGRGGGDRLAWLKVIKQFEPGRFKPIINFVKGKTTWPDEKVVELMAWLIDFKPRPHESERIYPIIGTDDPAVNTYELAVGSHEKEEEAKPRQVPRQSEKSEGAGTIRKPSSRQRKRKIVIPVLVIATAIVVIYWAWPNSSSLVPMGHGACMYWTGDHYEQIPCNQKLGATVVIPLDSEKIAHFKKITRPDTITENALGSIWYAKFNGVYECFTSPGHHPIDTNLELKLLTDYVLIRHIHGDHGAEKTPR